MTSGSGGVGGASQLISVNTDDQLKTTSTSRSAFFNPPVIVALSVFLAGVFLALLATANPPRLTRESAREVDARMRRTRDISLAPSGGVHEAWVARYNGPGNDLDVAEAIAVDNSGNVYVTGRSSDVDFSTHYATIKYNSAGQQQWIARYYGPRNYQDVPTGIAVDKSGNVYVTGYSFGSGNTYDYATIKYNSDGQEQWVARYNGPGNGNEEVASTMVVDGSGNVYVTGASPGRNTGFDYATVKYVQNPP